MAQNATKYSASDQQIVSNVNREVPSLLKTIKKYADSKLFGLAELCLGLVVLLFPPIAIFLLVILLFAKYLQSLKQFSLPLYLPKSMGKVKDPNYLKAGTDFEQNHADGVWYYGTEAITGKHIYLPDDMQRQHQFYNASTGGGKTESLTGLLINTFNHASAFSFIDGKADLGFPAKIMSIAHRYLRTDDVFLFNFIQGSRDLWGKTESQMSNSFNPFSNGTVSSLTELFKSLLDGDGDIWAKRAESFISAYIRVMVYLRDTGEIPLSVKHFAEAMPLEKMGALVGRPDIPEEIKNELYNFICNIPGMDKNSLQAILKGQSPKGNATIYDQYGYVSMQIIPIINMLKGDYGYIFNVTYGEINMRDIVANRRIMICLLPALEKSSSTLQQLGRIAVSAVKDMAAGGLGSVFEGNQEKNLEQRFTTSKSAYPVICDEAGYYFVKGAFAPLFAQARSVGLSMMLSAQDIPALRKMGEDVSKEVDSVIGNANTKLYGRIEDMASTYEEATKRIGKVHVATATSKQAKNSGGYYESDLSITEKERVHQLDFARLREGQVFMAHMDLLVRANLFAVFPRKLKMVTMNSLTTIPKPTAEQIEQHKRIPESLAVKIRQSIRGNIAITSKVEDKDLTHIASDFSQLKANNNSQDITIGLKVLATHMSRMKNNLDEVMDAWSTSTEQNGYANKEGLYDTKQTESDTIAQAFDDGATDEKSNSDKLSHAQSTYNRVKGDFGNIFDTGLLDESVFKAGSNAINVALTGDVAGSNTDTEKAIKKIKETTLYPTQPKPTMNKETVKSLLEDTLSEMDDFL